MNKPCPRKNCKNQAEIDATYGVLACRSCRDSDVSKRLEKIDELNINKLHRKQKARDVFGGEMLQPFDGNKPNPKFFRRYPEKIKDYKVANELKKM